MPSEKKKDGGANLKTKVRSWTKQTHNNGLPMINGKVGMLLL